MSVPNIESAFRWGGSVNQEVEASVGAVVRFAVQFLA